VRGSRAGVRPTGEVLLAWLRRLALFHHSKHPIAAELLRHTDATDPVFGSSRDRVLAAGRPQLLAAHQAHQVRADLGLDQVLDLVLIVAGNTLRIIVYAAEPGAEDAERLALGIALGTQKRTEERP